VFLLLVLRRGLGGSLNLQPGCLIFEHLFLPLLNVSLQLGFFKVLCPFQGPLDWVGILIFCILEKVGKLLKHFKQNKVTERNYKLEKKGDTYVNR
jgi:hypothetical protein